jgi:2-methylcitrate dehydratase PrpD
MATNMLIATAAEAKVRRSAAEAHGETHDSKYTVEKIAEFVDGCSSSAIQPDVRDLVARHLLDSIGCAIGAMGAKVTQDIKAVVDAFGGNQMCTFMGAV